MEYTLRLGEECRAWGLGQKFFAGDMEVPSEFFPDIVFLDQQAGAAPTVDQLGIAAFHERQEPIGHGLDGHL